MKRSYVSYLMLALVFIMATVASCTKEGPAGPPGKDGVDGEDGINGTDGTATCIQCHSDDQVNFAKTNQWAHSTHATGGNFERNEGECAICHTSQGFLRYNVSGTYDPDADGAMIPDPNPVNCYTCHQIHSTYEVDDYAFTVTAPAMLRNTDGQTFDFGFANLCATCHQGRTVDPWPVPGSGDIVVTSSRYGVHHGPQANALSGMGLEGFGAPSNHPHKNITNACVTCHMAEPYGVQSGGHTMFMGYEYHGAVELNINGCIACHSDEESLIANTEELQIEVQTLLDELKVLLDAAGITAEGSDSSIPGTYPADVAAACLNYKALTEDRSLGIHNPTYIKKTLQNSIAALQ
jgi:hypothetical protein